MAKVKLSPGVELDILTAEELRSVLTDFAGADKRGPTTARPQADIELDSSGNTAVGSSSGVAVPLYRVMQGFRFSLHRLSIMPDTYTFAAPFTNASGYLELVRANRMIDGVPLSGNYALPIVFTYGTADAPVYDNGQAVSLLIVGGPASKALQIEMQGTLEPITTV